MATTGLLVGGRGARASRVPFGDRSSPHLPRGRGRFSVNVRVADLDPPGRIDNRKIEVVADGLPLFHGAQLAVDATLVSPIRGDGSARRQCADHDGAALQEARHKKESTYPEVARPRSGRARLVVLGCKIRGRWSDEARDFVSQLAKSGSPATETISETHMVPPLEHSVGMQRFPLRFCHGWRDTIDLSCA